MRNESQPIIRTENLTRNIEDKCIVDGVSISVQAGDVLAIVGASGAGKTSFLRLINRLDEPTAGTVYLNGQDYHTIPPRDLRRRVGMVMQIACLFPGTVADNVGYGPRQRGVPVADARIAELLAGVGLVNFAGRDVAQLSGGEAQRVALARALANQPDVLLMDEPTSALDDATIHDVEDLLTHIITAHGLTCLIITHDMAQAKRLATHIMVMEKGRLLRVEDVPRAID